MKRKQCIIVCLCFFSVVAMAQNKKLLVLHTNDTHSCIMPLNPKLSDKSMADRGGFLRRIAMLKEERAKNPGLLLFDSGDFSQGSPFYTLYKGDVEVNLMNRMGYDAGTIGNHEFDFGLENMVRLFRKLNFPIVCSNYDFTGTVAEGVVKRWTIVKRNGVKIGIFGLSPKLEGLVDMNNCAGVKYLDPVKVANEMTHFLKNKKKCDLIICISHMGWDEQEINDQQIIPQTRDIDLVLGGHSHTYMETIRYVNDLDGHPVAVDQNGKSGIWIGRMELDMEKGRRLSDKH